MRLQRIFILACSYGVALLLCGCSVPRLMWPQKDLPSSESPGMTGGHVVLVASRSSEFKKALVNKLSNALISGRITQRTIGVDNLKEIDAAEYDAVVVISTCIAWGLDPEVQLFLNRQEKHADIILVTTSGDAGWLPNTGNSDIDAISSASKMTNVDAVARDVMAGINSRLYGEDKSHACP